METFWFFRFRHAYDSAYNSDFKFSLGYKRSNDSDSASVASEDQPFETKQEKILQILWSSYLEFSIDCVVKPINVVVTKA